MLRLLKEVATTSFFLHNVGSRPEPDDIKGIFVRLDGIAADSNKENSAAALMLFCTLSDMVRYRDLMVTNLILAEIAPRTETYGKSSPNLACQAAKLAALCRSFGGQLPRQRDVS